MKEKILFIINPKAGTKKNNQIETLISKYLDSNNFLPKYITTNYQGHANKIVQSEINSFDIIAAVGGDGTVNEIVNRLSNSDLKLAIVPIGSGNGLARYLNISGNIKKAIQIINYSKYKDIDIIEINEKICVNVAGIGFDAHIGNIFQTSKKRGFLNYARIVFKEFAKYHSQNYLLKIDGEKSERNAFLISFANSTQFGNNAYIAPKAEIDDGKIDVVIINKFPLYQSVILAFRLFTKTLHRSKYVDSFKAEKISIENNKNMISHIDGEPIEFIGDIHISIKNKSLKVICP